MNNTYEPPEIVGIIIGLILFAGLIMFALLGRNSEPSDYPSDIYCDQKTGCY